MAFTKDKKNKGDESFVQLIYSRYEIINMYIYTILIRNVKTISPKHRSEVI